MKNSKTDSDTTNSQNVQSLNDELDDLLGDAKTINKEIDKTNKNAEEKIDDIDAQVKKSIDNTEELFSDLDKLEEEAGDELDKIALEQSEDLAEE